MSILFLFASCAKEPGVYDPYSETTMPSRLAMAIDTFKTDPDLAFFQTVTIDKYDYIFIRTSETTIQVQRYYLEYNNDLISIIGIAICLVLLFIIFWYILRR